MPFEQITTVRHYGEANPDEMFLIRTTAGDYVGGAEYTEYPHTALCLHSAHWTHEVKDAANDLRRASMRKGISIELSSVTAWIMRVPQFIEGADNLLVELRVGNYRESRLVMLEGTIISLAPCETPART